MEVLVSFGLGFEVGLELGLVSGMLLLGKNQPFGMAGLRSLGNSKNELCWDV